MVQTLKTPSQAKLASPLALQNGLERAGTLLAHIFHLRAEQRRLRAFYRQKKAMWLELEKEQAETLQASLAHKTKALQALHQELISHPGAPKSKNGSITLKEGSFGYTPNKHRHTEPDHGACMAYQGPSRPSSFQFFIRQQTK